MSTTRDDSIHAEVCMLGLGTKGVRIYIDSIQAILSDSEAEALAGAILRCLGKQNHVNQKEPANAGTPGSHHDWAWLAADTLCRADFFNTFEGAHHEARCEDAAKIIRQWCPAKMAVDGKADISLHADGTWEVEWPV